MDPLDPYPYAPDDFEEPLQVAQKLEISAKIRALGNQLFKEQMFAEAAKKYGKAVNWTNEEFPSPEEEISMRAV